MKASFPQQDKRYIQTNRSNIFGNLWSTFNIDLQSNLGAMRTGPKLKLNTSTADAANLGCPIAFKEFDGRIFTIGDTRIFKNSADTTVSTFVEDSSTAAPTTCSADRSDMVTFNSVLAVSAGDHLFTKVANTSGTGDWTNRGTPFTGNNNKMVYFKKFNRLYALNQGASVISFSTSSWTPATSGDYTLATNFEVGEAVTIVATSDSLWIGLVLTTSVNNRTARGVIWQWDGISAQITREYVLDASGCLAMAVDNDIPYAIDSNGVLLQFTGSSFEEIGRLPLNLQLLINATAVANSRFIHPNGLIPTKNGTFLALINNQLGDNTGSILENLPSGVWEWSKENGFVHRDPLSYMPVASSTITDFGQNRISRAGALINADLYSTAAGHGTLLVGANYFTDATTVTSGIFTDAPIPTNNSTYPEGQKKGYFVTTWIESDEIESKWSRLWAAFRKFQNSTDSIIFKYRTSEESPVEATITWTSTTTFTVPNSSVVVSNYWTGGTGTTGGEVEITQGTGGASCSHIVNAVNNAGTWTVTLDNPVTGVTNGTAKARFQKWIKIFPELNQTSVPVKSYGQMVIGANDTRIQIKGCLTWTGDGEFYKLVIAANEDIKVTL